MPTSTAQPATSHPGPPWLAPLWSRTEIDLQWLAVGFVMLGSALVFFGWRAMLSVTVTAVVCVIVFVLWRKALQLIRPNGPQDSSLHALVLGVLGGLSMPAVTQPSMPVLAGILLGILAGVIGRTHRLRIHPVAAV